MKVYVDKLPKNCSEWNCPFNYDTCNCRLKGFIDVGDREIEYFYENGRHKTCPLQSLTDYTKQVRKEVCEEFKEKLKPKEIFHPEDEFTLDYDFYYKEDVEEILDQIQGETKC